VLEPASAFTRENAAIDQLKSGARHLLANHWGTQFGQWPQRLQEGAEFIAAHPTVLERERPVYEQLPVDPWRRAFAVGAWGEEGRFVQDPAPVDQSPR
jgi:hypothetical protein